MEAATSSPKHWLLTQSLDEIYPNVRITGCGPYFFSEWHNVRVPDVVKDLVIFLCVKGNEERYHFGGTGFFVSILEGDEAFVYLVTARHNIDHAAPYGDLYIRANGKDGKGKIIKVVGEWIFPENAGIDVALKLISPQFREFSIGVLPSRLFVTRSLIQELDIGIGDNVMVVGLFTNRQGNEKNLPIIRVGHIAAMPDEPFEDLESGFQFDAYLAELRSLGGLSGSPVLVVPSSGQRDATAIQSYLLGLVRGHWNLKRPAGALDFSEDELVEINTGIAQVTPIQDVADLLNRDDLVKQRRQIIKGLNRADGSGLVLD